MWQADMDLKGWSLFSSVVASATRTVTENVIQPGMERVMDPELQSTVKGYASAAGQRAAQLGGVANEWSKHQLGVDVAGQVSLRACASIAPSRLPHRSAASRARSAVPWASARDPPRGTEHSRRATMTISRTTSTMPETRRTFSAATRAVSNSRTKARRRIRRRLRRLLLLRLRRRQRIPGMTSGKTSERLPAALDYLYLVI
jgi:hypothetical protein